MSNLFILAVVGESPAVLTELLWWISRVERAPLAGIEVWATGRGAARLRSLVEGPTWDELQEFTAPMSPLQPATTPPSSAPGFRVHTLMHDGAVLDDVTTPAESGAVSAVLHDRVRALRAELADHIQLVGSLAGGRKTVSAGLQTAFCLQAGRTDRLVHVVLHPQLEARLRAERRLLEYAFPHPRWTALSALEPHQQVLVYDVPFPRLRWLVPRRLSSALRELPFDDVWPVLEANMGRHVEARLARRSREWHYELVDRDTGQPLYSTTLTKRRGAVLAAMAHAEPSTTAAQIITWLDTHDVGWAPPSDRGADTESRARSLRTAASELRRSLEGIPVGLERYAPPDEGFVVQGIDMVAGATDHEPRRGP